MASRVITGLHAIEESLRRGEPCERLIVSGSGKRVQRLVKEAKRARVPVQRASAEELMRIGGAKARGAILIALEDSAHTSFEDAVTALTADQALILALDGITDPHNLGAVLRSADQFRVDLVVLPERRSASVNDTVSRTSAGADRWVSHSVVPNLVRALTFLQERGFWIYGADASGAPAHTVTLTGRTVLVLGREGEGLHRLVRDTCDGLVAIPTGGRIDSLNVSVSAGVLLYEVRRQADFAALQDRWSHESS